MLEIFAFRVSQREVTLRPEEGFLEAAYGLELIRSSPQRREDLFPGSRWVRVDIAQAGYLEEPGHPMLPQDGLFAYVPDGWAVPPEPITDLTIGEVTRITISAPVLPAPRPALTGAELGPPEPDPNIYFATTQYPGELVRFHGQPTVGGRRVAHVTLTPIQYVPGENILLVHGWLSFRLRLVPERRIRGLQPVSQPRYSPIASLVTGAPEDAWPGSLPPPTPEAPWTPGVIRHDGELLPTLPPRPLDDPENRGTYLILTTRALREAVTPLAEAKAKRYSVKVVTVQDVLEEFPPRPIPSEPPEGWPCDASWKGLTAREREGIRRRLRHNVEAEAIARFLRKATEWAEPPAYLLLAGDVTLPDDPAVEIVPTHFEPYTAPGAAVPDRLIPSDYYYVTLGEKEALPPVASHGLPQLMVGRLPFNDPEVMERICRCIAEEYGRPDGEWRRRLLLCAYADDPLTRETAAGYMASHQRLLPLLAAWFQVPDGLVVPRELPPGAFRQLLSRGYALVAYRGHGTETGWDGVRIEDVLASKGGPGAPTVLSIACSTAAVDAPGECFGEAWLREGRATGFLGASRPVWTTQNDLFNAHLFDALLLGERKPGRVLAMAAAWLLRANPGSRYAQDVVRAYLLLGDPDLDIALQRVDAVDPKGLRNP